MDFELSADNAIPYLAERGLITPAASRTARSEFLGGGVSNVVIRVSADGTGGDGLVLKQSLPKLRVEEDWFADRERIYRERAGIDYLSRFHARPGPAAATTWSTPQVIHEDRKNFLFVMTSAPQGGANWKESLLAGDIDPNVAARVGAMLGEIHGASAVNGDDAPADLRAFADLDCFVQLRIDPYHRATAAAHPDLAGIIEAEARRMLPGPGDRRALVHGDFSPKNIIVNRDGADARIFLLDFEVVHLGNPVFDLAFMLNHFTLKAIYQPQWAKRYNQAVQSFWSHYLAACDGNVAGDPDDLERDTVRQLGTLLLARIDGKSPAEYLTADHQKEFARTLARSILTGETATLSQIHHRLNTMA